MNKTPIKDKAEILAEALPYIKKYAGKILVIKYGGNAMVSEELKESVMKDLVLLSTVGIKVVLVHGGGPEINKAINSFGKESKFIDGLRYTDEETAGIVQMVLAGKVNKSLVAKLSAYGGKAVGLSGVDGGMLESEMLDEKLGYVGKITKVNCGLIDDCLEKGYIPVVSTIGYDGRGKVYNINADTCAAEIAAALKAESLILMTDVKGLFADKNDENSLIEEVNVKDIPSMVECELITGGMLPKTECCKYAVENGVKRVFIIDGRVPHAILIEILSDEGIGTMFY